MTVNVLMLPLNRISETVFRIKLKIAFNTISCHWVYSFFEINKLIPACCACAFSCHCSIACDQTQSASLEVPRPRRGSWKYFNITAHCKLYRLTLQVRRRACLREWLSAAPRATWPLRPGCRGYQPLRLSSSDHRSVFLARYSIRRRWGREISRGRMLVFDLGEACPTPRWRAQHLLLRGRVFVDVFDESTASLRQRKKGKKEQTNGKKIFEGYVCC